MSLLPFVNEKISNINGTPMPENLSGNIIWDSRSLPESADVGEPQEREGSAIKVLPMLRQSAAAMESTDGRFDDPPFWHYHEPVGVVGPLDDLDPDLPQDPFQRRAASSRPMLIAADDLQPSHG